MYKYSLQAILLLSCFMQVAFAQQSGPYQIRNSIEFESPKKHKIGDPIAYGDMGIIQINSKGSESYSFQLFSNDLKLKKENIALTEGKLGDKVNHVRTIKFKNKTYFFFREVFRDEQVEGISALEFSPENLDFKGISKNLFKSSSKVRVMSSYMGTGGYSSNWIGEMGYNFVISMDESKFLMTYALLPKEKKDELNNDIIGMHVYDENLNLVWGDEIKMPYTEAKMDNLGYTVGNDGKVYLLARVYEGINPKDGKKEKTKPNYHYEVLVFEKGSKKANIIEIALENRFPKSSYIFEDINGNIVVSGFYAKAINKPIDGAYMVKLDLASGRFSKVKGGYYEIPSDIIKSFTSEREKRKLEKKESKDEENDIGIENLEIKKIYLMEDGSTKIVSEQYYVRVTQYYDNSCKCWRTRYDTYADDIFVLSISESGNLDWVKKIPKSQHSAGAQGPGISINTYATGNDLHIFFIDNIKNMNLPENEAPKRHEDRRGGYLTAVNINSAGKVTKYSLGEIAVFDTNFYIRYFVDGKNNNLISTERKKKKNILFSIDIK